jgi:hypothetical protein
MGKIVLPRALPEKVILFFCSFAEIKNSHLFCGNRIDIALEK